MISIAQPPDEADIVGVAVAWKAARDEATPASSIWGNWTSPLIKSIFSLSHSPRFVILSVPFWFCDFNLTHHGV